MRKAEIKARIQAIEDEMSEPTFWEDKAAAQEKVKELNSLKEKLAGKNKYDKGNAIMTLFSGAGGVDAEDFTRMLFEMYRAFAEQNGWEVYILHQNENEHGGYSNITFEVKGQNAYGMLKNEAGVHRLVRISPFNAKKQRHTAFAMADVVPALEKGGDIEVPESDLKIEFSKSGGPGGQSVNKRETAVRLIHIPTNTSVHVDSERSQMQNREKAMDILKGKLYRMQEEEREQEAESMSVSKTTDAEWGNQIRSYVLHPYKMVKDHRTGYEVSQTEKVLEDGDLEPFITALKEKQEREEAEALEDTSGDE